MTLCVVTLLVLACAASISAKRPSPLVENGEEAKENDFSVIVLALARETDQRAVFGGGSIISKRHILTAAHLCIDAKLFRLGYGHVKAREVVRLSASSAFIHSHFNSKTLENDLAIITLPQNTQLNMDIVKPLVISRNPVKIDDQGTVASFGFESDSANTISENLMVARQIVIDNEACADAFGRPVHANQFCGQDPIVPPSPPPPPPTEPPSDEDEPTEGPPEDPPGDPSEDEEPPPDSEEGGSDWNDVWGRGLMARIAADDKKQSAVCRGDTGSAVVRTVDEKLVGFGIVSRVPRGCNAKLPALYTHLPAFVQWLDDATLGDVQIVDV